MAVEKKDERGELEPALCSACAASRNAYEMRTGKQHSGRLTTENMSLRRRLRIEEGSHDLEKKRRADAEAALAREKKAREDAEARLAAGGARKQPDGDEEGADPDDEGEHDDSADSGSGERLEALLWRALAKQRTLNPQEAFETLAPLIKLEGGKLTFEGEPIEDEDWPAIINPANLPAKSSAGSGGRTPKLATNVSGTNGIGKMSDEELVERGYARQDFYNEHREEILAAERRLGR